ncbi:SDR family oxidoreductase [Chitinophaga agrisoli]|uniref:SDR family oxidoreductase n=1 Tax=Chitinophaga agrisoli TaxID=2607653 RepID=A0A5B2VM65_9BACT|nr:SDR family oxidoreductase [Chitinophaga agrisoli]KAA2239798.1 SDR family oxidoreductase [Chitinophaga agrisoli]
MNNLKDKVIVITGASSGMGAATARKLQGTGAKVILAARRKDRLDELVAELGNNFLAVQADVSKRDEVDQLVARTIANFGTIDVFWNNAAIMPLSFFEEGKVDEWERMIDINIKGVLYGIHSVLPHMLKNGNGHIVATSSIGGWKTFPSGGVYGSTKFAVRAIMDTLRQELAGKIKVTTIYPGSVTTELGRDITSKKVFEMLETYGKWSQLDAAAIADAFIYAISQPGNVAVNDLLIRPIDQPI